MGIPKGTKLTDNPKNKTFKLRIDDETYDKLEILSEEEKKSKSDIIRQGIEIQFEQKHKK